MNLVSDCFKNDYLVFIDNVFILYEVIIIHILSLYLFASKMYLHISTTRRLFYQIKLYHNHLWNRGKRRGKRSRLLVAKHAISRSDCKSVGKFRNWKLIDFAWHCQELHRWNRSADEGMALMQTRAHRQQIFVPLAYCYRAA